MPRRDSQRAPTSHRPGLLPAICRTPYPAPATSHTPRGRRFTTTKSRRAGDATPLPRPCPGCASLRCVAPSSTSPALCTYKRAAPSPCSHASEYHHHPSISTATRPHRGAPLSAPPPPNRGSKWVALDLLVLPAFPTLPSLTEPPLPIARNRRSSCSPPAAQLRPPQPQTSTPTGFPRSPHAPLPFFPRRRLVPSPDFGREQLSPA
jgi:hypothetical protein